MTISARVSAPGPLSWSATSGATTQASSPIGSAAAAQTAMMPPKRELGQRTLAGRSRGLILAVVDGPRIAGAASWRSAMVWVGACMSSPFTGGGFMTGTSAVQRPGELGAQRRDLSDCGAYDGASMVDDVSLRPAM